MPLFFILTIPTAVSDTAEQVEAIYINLETLDTELTSVNSNIATCKGSFDRCEDAGQSCYTTAGLKTTDFDEGFDTASVRN